MFIVRSNEKSLVFTGVPYSMSSTPLLLTSPALIYFPLKEPVIGTINT